MPEEAPKETTAKEEAPARPTQIVVGAGGLEFVTEEGRPLARLDIGPFGGGALTLLGPQGEISVIAGTAEHGGVISAKAQVGEGCVTMFVDGRIGGRPSGAVAVFNAAGQEGAEMGAGEHGGAFAIYEPNEHTVGFWHASEEGGNFGLCRRDGMPVIRASAYEEEGALVVFSKEGAPVFAVPVWKMADARGQGPGTEPSPPKDEDQKDEDQNIAS